MFMTIALAGLAEAAMSFALLLGVFWMLLLAIIALAALALHSRPLAMALALLWIGGTLLFLPFQGLIPHPPSFDSDVNSWAQMYLLFGLAWASLTALMVGVFSFAWRKGRWVSPNKQGFPVVE